MLERCFDAEALCDKILRMVISPYPTQAGSEAPDLISRGKDWFDYHFLAASLAHDQRELQAPTC